MPSKKIEYLHKKSIYLFPADSKIFVNGGRLLIELGDKEPVCNKSNAKEKTHEVAGLTAKKKEPEESITKEKSNDTKIIKNISPYLSKKKYVTRQYDCKIGLPITGRAAELSREYSFFIDFFARHTHLTYADFDHFICSELPLCTFFKQSDLIRADNLIRLLEKEMPYLINIFTRPLIHLRDADVILPVDMVQRINNDTLNHLSSHTENWENISGGEIVPQNLLTKVYEDDYSIYENVVFRDLIDKYLVFLKKRIYNLSEILDAFNKSVQLDAFTRLNHQTYYLALGKLYLGFTKMDNSAELVNMLERTMSVYRRLNKHKTRAVYAKNAGVKPIAGRIKLTNILLMHRDYKHVYSLYQRFDDEFVGTYENSSYDLQNESQAGYGLFCQALIIFAASHFNMTMEPNDTVFDNGRVSANFAYKGWFITVKSEFNPILDFDTIAITMRYSENVPNETDGKAVSYLIIPISHHITLDKSAHYRHIIDRLVYTGHIYDKYVFLEPFDEDLERAYNYCTLYRTENFASRSKKSNQPKEDWAHKEKNATHLAKNWTSDSNKKKADRYYAVLPVSVSEVNSFRRIQKLLMECMLLCDNRRKDCAFCGGQILHEGGRAICQKCRTTVKTIICECGNCYTGSYIDTKGRSVLRAERGTDRNLRKHHLGQALKDTKADYLKDFSDFYKQEKQYLFRNIVNMTENGFICPCCGAETKI